MNTKSSLANIGEILGAQPSQFTFLNPPMIAAPNTTITDLNGNPRKLPDPSKTLSPVMGKDRVHTKTLKLITSEKGTNGEQVWGINNDDRVRFVGTWNTDSAAQQGSHPLTNSVNDYVEVTFYGTGLNALIVADNTSRTLIYNFDGGADSASIYPVSGSAVLATRNYPTNQVVNLVTNQTLGLHTIKLRLSAGVNFRFYGFEILNEASTIKIPQGEILANGRKYSNSALQSLAYNSGFDGAPVLNGKGGRVVIYQRANGVIGKAIQQTNATQQNTTSANHSNEEALPKINFRKFGAGRADDFLTLNTTPGDRAFTLDDGTTTLVGKNSRAVGSDVLNPGAPGSSFITLTFVGTGLDVIRKDDASSGTAHSYDVIVNGTTVGSYSNAASTNPRIEKLVSGLPYGTHTVKLLNTASPVANVAWTDFIVYVPKKPSIPADAVQLKEYFLMADFVSASAEGLDTMSVGTLRKHIVREMVFAGTWSALAINVGNTIGAFQTFTSTANSYIEYTFIGTGVSYRMNSEASQTQTVSIDGASNFTTTNSSPSFGAGWAVAPTVSFLSSGVTWTPSAGTITGNGGPGGILSISGLNYGIHKVRVELTSAGGGGLFPECFDIITPIHYPNIQTGSLSMGPSVQLAQSPEVNGVDLTKAKAWLIYDLANQLIIDSFNISGVIRETTGTLQVYLEKPFIREPIILGTSQDNNLVAIDQPFVGSSTGDARSTFRCVVRDTAANLSNPVRVRLVFFGELADEET